MSTNPLNVAANWFAIRALAPDRFDAFRKPGDADELDAVARYVWNMAVSNQLRDAKTLRNRISYHEPIVFDVRLPQYHAQIMELIQWMNPQMSEIAQIEDDFLAVYGRTWTAYRPIVEELFG